MWFRPDRRRQTLKTICTEQWRREKSGKRPWRCTPAQQRPQTRRCSGWDLSALQWEKTSQKPTIRGPSAIIWWRSWWTSVWGTVWITCPKICWTISSVNSDNVSWKSWRDVTSLTKTAASAFLPSLRQCPGNYTTLWAPKKQSKRPSCCRGTKITELLRRPWRNTWSRCRGASWRCC